MCAENFSFSGWALHEIWSHLYPRFGKWSLLGLFVWVSWKIEDWIFFETAFAIIHKTLPSTIYIKLSKIGRGLHGLALKHISCSIIKQLITRCQCSQCAWLTSDTDDVSASVIRDALIIGVSSDVGVSLFNISVLSDTEPIGVHWAPYRCQSVFSNPTPPLPKVTASYNLWSWISKTIYRFSYASHSFVWRFVKIW